MCLDLIRKPLEELLKHGITGCACGKVHRIPTRETALRPGALNMLPRWVDHYFPPGLLLCVVDSNTWAAAGETAVRRLRNLGKQAEVHFVDHLSQRAHADRKTVDTLISAIQQTGTVGLIAVGSGTINDISKSAATAASCPQITVATAASMNGYTSAISALTVDGVKVTEPCNPPVAIIADPEILATAPKKMSGAGFGDLLSKNASTADWLLSHSLFGDYYCALSASLAEDAINHCIKKAESIKKNLPEGLTVLTEALLRSGISMVMAGSSSPASGGEHLISHLWDMTAHWSGREPALHGEQTGVTTLISLRLYEKLLALEPAAVRSLCRQKPVVKDQTMFETEIRKNFRDIADVILPFARRKYLNEADLQRRRNQILSCWNSIRDSVQSAVIPMATSRRYLQAAGAVFRSSDLGISPDETVFAYRYARWIRNRYTVLDLAAELGVLEKWEQDVLSAV